MYKPDHDTDNSEQSMTRQDKSIHTFKTCH